MCLLKSLLLAVAGIAVLAVVATAATASGSHHARTSWDHCGHRGHHHVHHGRHGVCGLDEVELGCNAEVRHEAAKDLLMLREHLQLAKHALATTKDD